MADTLKFYGQLYEDMSQKRALLDRVSKEMQTPRFLIESSDRLVDSKTGSGKGNDMYGSPHQVPTCRDFAQHQANMGEGTPFHRTFMTRIASLLSELGAQKSASLAQAREARELIHLIGKEIGAKQR